MSRRNQHSRDQLRELAITSLRRLVLERGVDKLSVREVARRLGYAPGMIYHLFENLDDLILHANAVTLDQLLAGIDAVDLDDPRRALAAMAGQYLDLARERGPLWQLLFRHRMAAAAPVPEWYQHRTEALFTRLQRPLAKLAPRADAQQRALAAATLWSAVHGICALYVDDKLDVAGERDPRRLLDNLLEHYLAGWLAGNEAAE